ncbi:MAG TPA: hypothetical protein ENJ77_00610, partial [Candidatus Moranbacteria bacterium]|nr:hypothetical protein [Candidatus Moranbacteria bacterium]
MREEEKSCCRDKKEGFSSSSWLSSAAEAFSAVVKVAEQGIVSRLEKKADDIGRNLALSLIAAGLALTGAILLLTSLAAYLGEKSGYGLWFGLLLTGA